MKKIRLFVVLICCYSIAMNGQKVNPDIDRMMQSIKQLPDGRTKVDTLNEIAFQCVLSREFATAYLYALKADSLAGKINYIGGQGASQIRMGQVRMYQSNFDKSEYHYKEGLKLRIQNGNQLDVVGAYLNLGTMFAKAGNLYGAIDNFKLGLEWLDKLNSKDKVVARKMAKTHNNLGLAYKRNGKYIEAETQFKRSIEMYEDLENKTNIALPYMNLGSLYYIEDFSDTLKSRDYLNKSLDLFIKMGNKGREGLCYINLGNLYFYRKMNDKAFEYYSKAKEKKQYLAPEDMMKIARNEGSVFFNNGEYDKALNIYETCLKEYESSNNKNEIARLYHDIGNVHFTQSNNEKASYYLNKSRELSEDLNLFGLKTTSLASIVNVKERELYKEQLQRKSLMIIGILALGMILVVAGFLIRLNQKKRQLAEKNAELFKKDIDVLVGDQVLKTTSARLEGIEQERKRIASDLHDEVGAQIATAKLYFAPMDKQLEKLSQEDRDKYQKATQILDETYDAVRQISHDMAAPSLSNKGLVKELQLLVNKIEEAKLLKVKLSFHKMENRLDNNIEIRLYRIVQELLTNALKHAKATEINIELNHFDKFINVIVEDNGVGFDQKSVAINEKTGMGLGNIERGVEALKGTMAIDSKVGRGTSITLDIPLQN